MVHVITASGNQGEQYVVVMNSIPHVLVINKVNLSLPFNTVIKIKDHFRNVCQIFFLETYTVSRLQTYKF